MPTGAPDGNYGQLWRRRGLWYWRIRAGNHRSICIGGEGVTKRAHALRMLELAMAGFNAGWYEVL